MKIRIGVGIASLFAACTMAAPALAQADLVTNQYGTRHAYQTAGYSNAVRLRTSRRYLSYIAYLDRRSHDAPTPHYYAAVRHDGVRRAYQTGRVSFKYNAGTRRAYQS